MAPIKLLSHYSVWGFQSKGANTASRPPSLEGVGGYVYVDSFGHHLHIHQGRYLYAQAHDVRILELGGGANANASYTGLRYVLRHQ